MKTILGYAALFVIGGALLLPPVSWAQNRGDEEAIKSVILAETDLFFARDFEGWAATFVPASNALQIWNNADGSYTRNEGWETIGTNIKAFMENNPEPDTTPLWRENFSYRPYGDAAFVTFDKYMGDRSTASVIKEVRVVERHDGEWKIVLVAAFMNHLPPVGTGD